MSTFESYVKRPATFIRQLDVDDWRVKIYGLSAVSNNISDELAETAIHNIPTYLPSPAINEHRYGVGFLIVHRGTLRNWFLLDWWEHGDILFHKLFSSPLNDHETISFEQEIPAIACIHELRVINFESNAWIENVLRLNPSLDDYMSCTFDDDAKAA
ncbi:MAG TPA: hypothetical protein VKA94_02165 [Hyphomicrobiales bacterium]|nr:hypothetical protein [Hyphomicrobiales bacterium]